MISKLLGSVCVLLIVSATPVYAFHTPDTVPAPQSPNAVYFNLAHPSGWATFMNPNTPVAMMNPATYAQFMSPQFYAQFMDPNNWSAWMNPSAYAPVMHPNNYMQWMNPAAYAQFMNPGTYMQWAEPVNYAAFMNPLTYFQWMNPAALTVSPTPQTGQSGTQTMAIPFNMFNPNAWMNFTRPNEESGDTQDPGMDGSATTQSNQ
ncbi:MAG: hypothetical protein OES26_07395 [Gammaproteobacteria bacterium]|nr:hypothetical protein [Gammaproteobacteria bacterium]